MTYWTWHDSVVLVVVGVVIGVLLLYGSALIIDHAQPAPCPVVTCPPAPKCVDCREYEWAFAKCRARLREEDNLKRIADAVEKGCK